MSKAMNIEDIFIGMKASTVHLITDEKIRVFATVSEDYNPVHLDEEYAEKSQFGKRLAHGALISSFFSALFAMKLPGRGSIYVSQSTRFKKPVFIDDEVLAEIEVIDIDINRRRVYFSTYCYVGQVKVLSGEAEIYIP